MLERHPTTDPRAFLLLAERHRPSLRLRFARPIDLWWSCFVLDVHDERILRFPRTLEDSKRIEPEVRLLPELEKRLSVPVPHYEHIIRDERGRIVLVSYPKRKGLTLP